MPDWHGVRRGWERTWTPREKPGLSRSFALRGAEKWGNSCRELMGPRRVSFLKMAEVITCLLME